MAIVDIRREKNLGDALEYGKDRGEVNYHSTHGCSKETTAQEFRNVARHFKKTRGARCIRVLQSWGPEESSARTPEEFHAIGREFTERAFPGHQYSIRTHTETGRIHNHIVVNTVNMNDGSFIQNTYYAKDSHERLIHKIRSVSDQVCEEHGLSVLHKDALERRARLPKDVVAMERAKKDSWKMDLIQKAHFALSISTNYDEYVAHLKTHDIEAHVENKNIRYLYPGEKRWIRGKTLTPDQKFNKERLEKAFAENDKEFKKNPKLRPYREAQLQTLHEQAGHTARDKDGKPIMPELAPKSGEKDYGEFTKVSRRERDKQHKSDRALENSMVPVEEIRQAKGSIFEYCKKHSIELTRNPKGEHVLKGCEHVVVREFEVFNTKNGVTGSLIDVVASHQSLTLMQAVARITGNKRVLELEKAVGKRGREFTSFYIPKNTSAPEPQAKAKVESVLSSMGANEKLADPLLKSGRVQVTEYGSVRFYGEHDGAGAAEFSPEVNGGWTKKTRGKAKSAFYSGNTSGKTALLFLEPERFMKDHGEHVFLQGRPLRGVLALLEPDHAAVVQYLSRNRNVRSVSIVGANLGRFSKAELDFFENLRKHQQILGVEVSQHFGPTKGLEKGPELSL